MQHLERQRVIDEVAEAKSRAESLLVRLIESRQECEAQLRKLNRTDAFKAVTGKSAIERAIESTRRMIDSLERAAAEARKHLADPGLAFLDSPAPAPQIVVRSPGRPISA